MKPSQKKADLRKGSVCRDDLSGNLIEEQGEGLERRVRIHVPDPGLRIHHSGLDDSRKVSSRRSRKPKAR